MRVLFVTSELASLFKLGGLADVSESLPHALGKLGVQVVVAMPYYASVHPKEVEGVGEIVVTYAGSDEIVFVFRTFAFGSRVPVYLFRHPLLNDYAGDDIVSKFAFFSKIVASFYARAQSKKDEAFDIVHCHDWHTALVPVLLGETSKMHGGRENMSSRRVKTILTIHNLLYQGVDKISIVDKIGVSRSSVHHFSGKHAHEISLFREGLEHVDVISTVSPTYAAEIVRSSVGLVGEVLARRRKDVIGILNGIDTHVWNPLTDPFLWATYSVASVKKGKAWNKKHLAKSIHLPASDDPLIAFVGRIEPNQKGIDIYMEAIRRCIDRYGFQMVVLGTGEPHSVRRLMDLVKQYPTRLSFIHAFDDKLAHRIYAGADILVVPSKFEPCGLTQMIAMRYGTLPVVRNTGGLADTVDNGKNGFVFEEYSGHDLGKKLAEVIQLFHEDKSGWHHMIDYAMKEDFSWEQSAKKYRQIYSKLLR